MRLNLQALGTELIRLGTALRMGADSPLDSTHLEILAAAIAPAAIKNIPIAGSPKIVAHNRNSEWKGGAPHSDRVWIQEVLRVEIHTGPPLTVLGDTPPV